jgi:hypothetical protein
MNANQPLAYAEEEVRSFLPTGWHLGLDDLEPAEGTWDDRKRAWRITVRDNVDFDWPVEVKAADVERLGAGGRLEALRQAMNKVYRERLG